MIQKNQRLEICFLLTILALFVVLFAVGLGYPPETRQFPMLVQGVAIVLLVVQVFRVLLSPPVSRSDSGQPADWRRSILCFAVMAIVLVITFLVGLIPAMVVLVFGSGWVFGARNKYTLLIVSVSTGVAIYLVFEVVLKKALYGGILFDM